MISRGMLLVDRFATLLLAAALIAAGALGVWWWTGGSPFAKRTDSAQLLSIVDAVWWPWASATAGIILILIGLRWIAAHIRGTKVKQLFLNGSSSAGRLDVDGSKVAGAAASAFEDTLGVRSASGSIRRNRGQIVANLNAAIEPGADLSTVAQSADQVSAQLAQVLGRNDLRCSVELKVARRGNSISRVS